MDQKQIGEIALIFLEFINQLKIYHWQTLNYARHIASDKLVSTITGQVDRFMEILQGSRNTRLVLSSKGRKIELTNQQDSNANSLLLAFKYWLLNELPIMLEYFDSDLSNIRDEMLGSVNNTLYLYTLN